MRRCKEETVYKKLSPIIALTLDSYLGLKCTQKLSFESEYWTIIYIETFKKP